MTIPLILEDRGLRAFHGDPAVKAKYVARVEAHRVADEIIQGAYTEKYGTGAKKLRGCAVGCTIHGNDHSAYERELGVPRWLARLEDRLHEMMPSDDAKQWPGRFLEAIPVGADLVGVYPAFVSWMLTDPTHGTLQFIKDEELRTLTQAVADHYRNGTMTRELGRSLADQIYARRRSHGFWATYYTRAAERDRLRAEARRLRKEADRLVAAGDPAAAAAAAAAAEAAAEAAEAAAEAAAAAAAAAEAAAAAAAEAAAVEAVAAEAQAAAAQEEAVAAWYIGRSRFALAASEQLLILLAEAPIRAAA